MTAAGQSAHTEYERRLRAWRTRSRRRFLRGLPFITAVAAGLEWWVGWHTTGVPLYGHAAALAALGAWTYGTLAAPRHVTAWRSGADGERRTALLLQSQARRGAVVLHDRRIPGSRANLDHLSIGPTGVDYIDTKNWKARGTRVDIGPGGRLWYGRYPQDRTLATVRWEAQRAAAEISRDLGQPVDVRAVIAVHGAPVGRRGQLTVGDVLVVEARRLPRVLRRRRHVLDSQDVARIAAAAERALPAAR